MIQASTWYMLAETSGSARGDFLVSFGGYSVCVRAIVAYNSSSLYILSNNISANTLISFRIRKLASKQYVDIKANKELDITYSIDNNNNWTTLFSLSGIGQEICALNNINGDYSEIGTVDYEDLLNKPSINGVTLIGDKKASDLNLQPAGDYADKQFETLFKKFFEYDEFHNAIKARLDFYTDTNKNISAGGYNNTGEIVVISSYSELKDKPFINGQELISGDNSLDKLGIQPKGNYTTNEFVEGLTNAIMEKLNLHIKDFEDFIKKLNTYFEYDSKNQAIKVLLDLYTVTGKNISAGGYNNSGTEIIVPKSYNELTEKPQINGQELLSGNNTLDKLGIQPKGNYVTNEIVESQISAIIEKLNSHITDFETFVNELNTYFKFEPDKQAIKVLYDLYTDTGKNISAGGLGGSGSSSLGALYQLVDVMINSTGDGVEGAVEGSVLAYDAIAGKWKAIAQSEILPDMSGYYTKEETDAAINAIPIYSMAKLSVSDIASLSDGANVREAYRLKKGGNNVDDTVIKIYKDSAIKSLELRDNKYLVLTYTDNEGNEQSISKDLSAIVNDNYVDLINNQEIGGIKTFTEKTIFKKDINVLGDGIFGGEVVAIAGEGTPAGVTDYSALTGKPSINGVTLVSGNNTLAALGIQAAGDYATNSGVTTLLADYAKKTFVANNYAGKAAFNSHIADTDIHITAEERVAWNAKWNYDEATIKAVKVTSASSADSVAWSGITGKPTTIAGYGITDAYTSSTIDSKLSGYLPLTGGIITGTLVKRHTGQNYITFQDSDGNTYGYLGFNGANTPIYIPNEANAIYTLIHSGNYNSYSPTLTGTGASGTWGIDISGNASSATKLQDNTAFTAWGQTFFENGKPKNVSGDLKDVRNISASGKAIIQGDIISGGEVAAIVGEGTPAGVTDYSALTGKPSINGVTLLSGNNTLASLGIQAAGDYVTNSGVTTLLADYATKTFVSNNYAGKAAFNSHTADTNIHITSAERDTWNAKWNYDEATIKAVKVTSASSADSVAWSGISGKPTTFTPSAHTHNASEISGLPTKLSAFTNDVGYITSITKSMVEGVLTGDITSHTHNFASLTSKPTTLAGYGITDAYTATTIDSKLSGYLPLSGGIITGTLVKRYTGQNYITFQDSDGNTYGYLGFNGANTPIYIPKEANAIYTLIHSGNIGSYNAGSATKLQTPRNIFGLPFDGTSDVNGDAHITGDLIVDGEVSALVA